MQAQCARVVQARCARALCTPAASFAQSRPLLVWGAACVGRCLCGALLVWGAGMFLSVDYALACDTLPSLESAAQGLGVWGVSAFLGSTLGPLMTAPLLAYFGWTANPLVYSARGYMAVNLAGLVYVSCAGAFLCYVRSR